MGHVTDLQGRSVLRFPTSKVGEVRKQIRQRLERLKPVHTFSGVARGSDEQLPALFQHANLRVQRRAIEYAKALFGKPKVIAVWDGKPGDGAGRTADAVERWQMDGYEVDIIDVSKL